MNIIFCLVSALMILFITPAWANLKWNIGGDVLTSYDDNITYAHTDKISSFIFKPSVVGGFIAEGKTEQVSMAVRLTQNIYASHSEFNNLEQSVKLNAKKELSSYETVTLTETFRHSEDPYEFEDAFGRQNGRYGIYTNDLGGSYTRVMNERWTAVVNAGIKNSILTREDLRDSVVYRAGLQNIYVMNMKNSILVDYDISYRTYQHGDDMFINSLSGGVRHFFTKQLYLDVKPGITFIRDIDGDNLVKPRYEVVLNDDIDETSSLKVSFLSDYGTNSYSQNLFESWRLSALFHKQFNTRLGGNVVAFYGRGHYKTTGITDRLGGVSLSATYALTRKTDIFLSYLFQKTDSNVSIRSYTKNLMQGGLKVSF